MGTLNKHEEPFFDHSDFINPAIILGITSKGESVTLSNCLQINENSGVGDAGHQTTSEFIAHFAFFGAHFENPNEIQFLSITIRLHDLDSWFNKSCIEVNLHSTNQDIVSMKLPDPLITEIGEFSVELGVIGNRNYRLNSATIQTNAYLTIISANKKPFEEFLAIVRLIQNFFTLLISDPTFVTEMTGDLAIDVEKANEPYSSTREISICYPAAGRQPEPRDVFWAFMLLPYSEIEDNFSDLLKMWVQKAEILKPVYDLYFAGIYQSIYPENEFLNLVQALETYHRRIFGGEYLNRDIYINGLYKSLLSAIPPDISTDFRSSLREGKLKYAFEYSLRKRLQLLCIHITEKMRINFLCNRKTIIDFAKRISYTRNYLTHYSYDLKELSITGGKDLHEANNQLKLIISICFLEQLGLPYKKIHERLKVHRRFEKYFSPD